MDFGALPPEINSGRMYAGPGSGPLVAAAAAWDALAAELHCSAASYSSVIADVTSGWRGPTAASMVAAIVPYVAWMSATAARAEQAATQARAATGAYEEAFAATVPPPVIAANRSLSMSLIATNILGQNTSAIAATEAHYAEMWAQDAVAMYGYAGSSAAATRLTPFTPPRRTANPGGLAAQSAAVAQATGANAQNTLSQLISAVPQALQGLTSPAAAFDPASALLGIANFITGPTSPFSYFPVASVPYLLAFQSVLLPMGGENLAGALSKAAGAPAAAGGGVLVSHAVSAGMGGAGVVGKLAVPPSWTAAAPALRSFAAVLPGVVTAPAVAATGEGGLFGQMALSSLAGSAIGGTTARPVGGAAPGVGGIAADGGPTTATIIVIPVTDE